MIIKLMIINSNGCMYSFGIIMISTDLATLPSACSLSLWRSQLLLALSHCH